MTIQPGDIISHSEMCVQEGFSLQKGMNFQVKGRTTIILMSLRKGAPYSDKVESDGQVLIYEGHDVPKNIAKDPKSVNQTDITPKGTLTENGKFFKAAINFKKNKARAELVKVYEKIKDGIWVYNGLFELIDAWVEEDNKRNVFKFKLRLTDTGISNEERFIANNTDLDHNRIIPTKVKLEVWKRDKGQCIQCGSKNNLHFDHILPFSKGGTSLKAENIQLLCARHNLIKHDKLL
ncbi:MAG: HNH endonuclease [Flavihumibacter sp.]|nr:HNH endonuclease [Flavihumibacter sp.]